MLNRLAAVMATLLVAVTATLPNVEGADTGPERLMFLTWADYVDPALIAQFEAEYGVEVELAYFQSDDHRDEILAENDAVGYDVVLVNGLMLSTYAKRRWLMPLPVAEMPGLAQIEPRWRSAFPAAERYGAAYFWGTLGIGYRRDLVPEGFSSWKDFFVPAEALRGHLSLLKNSRDVVGMALKTLGHSVNTDDHAEIHEAGRLLLAQKPFVRSYEYVQLGEQSALLSGEVWASLMYSGDALMLQEHSDQIAYVVPREGGNLWVDYLTVLRSSPQRGLAARFIDFLNRPEIAARNAEYVYYATPNSAAHAYLSEGYFANPVIHPGWGVIERSESYRELTPRAQKTLNTVFVQLVY